MQLAVFSRLAEAERKLVLSLRLALVERLALVLVVYVQLALVELQPLAWAEVHQAVSSYLFSVVFEAVQLAKHEHFHL